MELLPPRIHDPALLQLLGEILHPAPAPAATSALRQTLYRRGMDWGGLINFATQQDVLPPLIWAFRQRALLPPVAASFSASQRENFITTRLDAAFAAHAARQEDLAAQLRAIILALHHAGIVPVLLKGARYLAAPPGSWMFARPMRDIDLLIHPSEAAPALAALTGIGYIADAPTGLASHHLPELRLAGHHGVVELHTEALAPSGRLIFSTADIWHLAEPHADVLRLPALWQAFHAMLHHQASDDGFAQRIIALKPLWEFAQLCAAFTAADYTLLTAYAVRHGAADMLASWFLQAERIFGLALPAALPISAAARLQVEACFTEAAQPEPRRRARFLRRQLRRGFSAAMLANRYQLSPDQAGLRLRARHAWFLLKRYRGNLRQRLFGGP